MGTLLILWLLLSLFGGKGESTPYAYGFIGKMEKNPTKASVTMMWINEKKKEVSVVDFPSGLEYRSPTVGSYPISSMFAAYDHNGVSQKTMQTELSIFLRTRIQNLFITSSKVESNRVSLTRAILSSCLHRERVHPTLSDCVNLIGILASPAYSLRDVEYPSQTLKEKDSVGLQRLDRAAYGRWLSDHFSYSFGFDNQTLTVVNASGIPGVAKQASIIFKDLGFSVLSVTDASELSDDGKLLAQNMEVADERLLSFISTFFDVDLEVSSEKVAPFRTQMVFILGKKQVNFFTQ